MTESRKITDKEYITEFQPVGVWLLIEKDMLPKKTTSGIYMPNTGRDASIKFSGTGIIRKIVPPIWSTFEQAHDKYWVSKFKEGDHVGFSSSAPITSPAPPQWEFSDSGCVESMKFVQITITDITGIFLHTPEERAEWESRFKEVCNG